MDRRRRPRGGIPHRQSLVQDLRGNFRGVATFDGSTHLTVTKTQTITGEYKTFYKGKVIATPDEALSETLYSFVDAFFFLNANGELKIVGNGAPSTVLFDDIDTAQVHEIELELKVGGLRCTLDGVSKKIAVTWSVATWPSFSIGAHQGINRFYTGKMWDVSDHEEFWPLKGDLNGSLGNDAVLTGNDLFTEKYCVDASPKQKYGSFDGDGYVDFPTQFDLLHSDSWELELDLDMASVGVQSFMGDNEATADRLRSDSGGGNFMMQFTNNSSVNLPTTGVNGLGRTLLKITVDGDGNVKSYHDGQLRDSVTATNTAISIDNLGQGHTSFAKFIGKSYRTTLSVNGETVLNLVPTTGGKFRDTASQSVVPIMEAETHVATVANDDQLVSDLYLGTDSQTGLDDWEVEFFDFCIKKIGQQNAHSILFKQSKSGFSNKIRVLIKSNGTLEFQNWGEVFDMGYTFTEGVVYENLRIFKIGKQVTIYVNKKFQKTFEVRSEVTTDLDTFKIGTWYPQDSIFCFSKLHVDHEEFNFDQGTGSTINGTENHQFTRSVTPHVFWDNGLANHTDITPSGTATAVIKPNLYALQKVAPSVVARSASVVTLEPSVATLSRDVVPIAEADRAVFTNVGTDFIDYGRPTWAEDNLRPTVDEFIVEAWFQGTTGTIVSFGAGVLGSERQLQLYLYDSKIRIRLGGNTASTDQLDASFFETPHHVRVVVSVWSFELYIDGESEDVADIDIWWQGTQNLFIGGRTNGSSYNFDGQTWDVKFSKGDGTLLEHFPLDGSPDGINGTVGTITDGNPTGVWDFGLSYGDADRAVFTNDGIDFIDYARPTWAVNNLRPTVDEFVIEAHIIPDHSDGTILAFGRDIAGPRQIQVYTLSGILMCNIGGGVLTTSAGLPVGEYAFIKVVVGLSTYEAFVNGVSVGSRAVGSDIGSTNLFIGGRTDGSNFNFEGMTWDVKFSKGDGTLLEHFPLDGSPYGVNGTVGTITDGEPTGVWSNGLSYEDSDRVVATFDGSNYLTVNKTVTLTSDYQKICGSTIIPESPHETERLYIDSNWFGLEIWASGAISFTGNGEPDHSFSGKVNFHEVNTWELYLKEDAVLIVFNGEHLETTGLSFTHLTSTHFTLSSSNSSRDYTGKMWDVSDHEEFWPLNGNLNGSLGNDAVLTGNALFTDGIKYEGSDRVVVTFDGSNYLTVNKAVTLTSEYQKVFGATIIPESPDGTEVLYNNVPNSNLYLTGSGSVLWSGNGGTGGNHGTVALGEVNTIELYFKLGAIKVIVNGITSEASGFTWNTTSWTSWLIGGRTDGSFFYTGKMWDVSDHEESWPLKGDLNGSLGTRLVEHVGGAYFFSEGITYGINANPTDSALLPYADEFTAKTELAEEHTGDAIFTSPNDGRGFKSLVYPDEVVLSESEKRKANRKVRR